MKPARTIDASVPSSARVCDYWLGGKDNFASDRDAAERLARAVPQLPWLARENRRFLARVVRFCASEGITQFLDIGTGLPTMESVHQVAARVLPSPRVGYVDNDPVVVSHAQALLATPGTVAVHGDLRCPEELLGDPDLRQLIDFSQPVAVLVAAVLHCVPAEDCPSESVARLREALAPGSYLAISHLQVRPGQPDSGEPGLPAAPWLHEPQRRSPARTHDETAAYFGAMTLVDPGLTEAWHWRPDEEPVVATTDVLTLVGGVARKGG